MKLGFAHAIVAIGCVAAIATAFVLLLSSTAAGSVVPRVGDVDCDDSIGPVDSLKILRFDAGMSVQQAEPCPNIGSDPATGSTPTPVNFEFTFPSFYADPDVFEATVTSITKMATIPNSTVTAPNGSKFAVVLMTVHNFSLNPEYVGGFSFGLQDNQQRLFSFDFDEQFEAQNAAETYYGREGLYDTIQPGLTVDMVFVFLVPNDAQGLTPVRCPSNGGC
jgi:hypothetical protein